MIVLRRNFMNVFGVIRIATVVGLSAIKVISAVLKAKEANQSGLINPIFANANNNLPYYNQPVNNNCNNTPVYVPVQPQTPQYPVAPMPPVQQHIVPESRRFWTPNFAYPTMNMGYDTPVPNMNAYEQNTSRRFMTIPQIQYQVPLNNIPVQQYPSMIPTMAPIMNVPNMNNSNGSYWRSYYTNSSINNVRQQQMYSNPIRPNSYPGKELQWADRTLGEMASGVKNVRQQYPPPPRKWTPMFNWNNPILRQTPQQQSDNNGVVAMFYTNDGRPLFGPLPTAVST